MFGLNDIYTGGFPKSATETRLLTMAEVMNHFRYGDRDAFMRFVKKSGMPRIRINRRRVMFDPIAVQAWVDRRSIGVGTVNNKK